MEGRCIERWRVRKYGAVVEVTEVMEAMACDGGDGGDGDDGGDGGDWGDGGDGGDRVKGNILYRLITEGAE